MLQALLVVPVLGAVYLVCAPTPVRRRLLQLLGALGALVLSAGWWVAVVALWPASSRPYIGGSQTNSILELTLGYNGFGRLTGNETGSVGGGGAAGPSWGATGLGRMFGTDIGGQIAWLLPAALVLLVTGLWLTRRLPRTDLRRASLLLWGGTLVVTGLVFSLMQGIFHAYYTVAMAPAIAALVGTMGVALWTQRRSLAARAVLAGTVALTAWWALVLLDRSAGWQTWLRPTIAASAGAAVLALLLGRAVGRAGTTAVAGLALVAVLAGPSAYVVQTVATAHTGSIVTAGPTVAGSGPGGAAGGRSARGARARGGFRGGPRDRRRPAGGRGRRCPGRGAGRGRRWPAAGHRAGRGAGRPAPGRREQLHLGRGGGRVAERGRRAAGQR